MAQHMRMDFKPCLLASLVDYPIQALASTAIGFSETVEEKRLLVLAQRCPLAMHLRVVAVELGHELATNPDISLFATLGFHPGAVARIKLNSEIAFDSTSFVRVENIRLRESSQFVRAVNELLKAGAVISSTREELAAMATR